MASVREELLCPICLEVFTNPVTLTCGHNFCWNCIANVLNTRLTRFYTCPQCRKRFRSRPVLTKNTTLDNIARQFTCPNPASVCCTYCDPPVTAVKTCLQCETSLCNRHLQNHNQTVVHHLMDCAVSLPSKKCPIHNRIRGYYYTMDATCICLVCRYSEKYRRLPIQPLDVAEYKKRKTLQKLRGILKIKADETIRRIMNLKKNIEKVQRQAGDQAETLTGEALVTRAQQISRVTDQIMELEKEKQQLEWKTFWVSEVYKEVDPIQFLEDVAIDDDDFGLLDALSNIGPLACHLFDATARVKKWWIPTQNPADIWLDVTTASNNLLVSDSRKTITYSDMLQPHPETSARFEQNQVMSINMFSSGRHYWDVACSQTGDWMIGVCYPSMDKKGKKSFLGCNSRSWCLRRRDNEFWVQHDTRCLTVPPLTSFNYIRVSLNCKVGQLTFHSLGSSITHLYTYNVVFTEALHAAFTIFSGWLQIRN
ncbi:E3 ubiquitin/ISG15 ligase TRIM25-like [Anomaloglossus baeobatrachus]